MEPYLEMAFGNFQMNFKRLVEVEAVSQYAKPQNSSLKASNFGCLHLEAPQLFNKEKVVYNGIHQGKASMEHRTITTWITFNWFHVRWYHVPQNSDKSCIDHEFASFRARMSIPTVGHVPKDGCTLGDQPRSKGDEGKTIKCTIDYHGTSFRRSMVAHHKNAYMAPWHMVVCREKYRVCFNRISTGHSANESPLADFLA